MKKTIAALLALFLPALLLFSCAEQEEPPSDQAQGGTLRVVTSIFAPYDFVRAITGGGAELTMLLPPASESHSYEPSPRDIIKIQNCDIFVYVGGESEAWVEHILASIDSSQLRPVRMMDCVEALEEELVPGMEALPEENNEDTAYDEHIWTSPKNAKKLVTQITQALCAADAGKAALYQKNAASYLDKLDALDAQIRAITQSAVRKTIVFGDRFPFLYFAKDYGLDYFAAFPGCSTQAEPSAATLKFLIDTIREEQLPVVFHTELSNQNIAKLLSESTGAAVLEFHACHNISKADFERGVTYLELMGQNAKNLQTALGEQSS